MNYADLTDLPTEIRRQRAWIEEHGGSRAGYVLRYGSAQDPEHSGAGGEAIHAADHAALQAMVDALPTWQARQRRRAAR